MLKPADILGRRIRIVKVENKDEEDNDDMVEDELGEVEEDFLLGFWNRG